MTIARSCPASMKERGFAIVSAIFLLVALAALGAFMVTFSTTQNVTSTQDIQGSRAYWAAKGGIQWAAYAIVTNGACPAGQPSFSDGFAVVVGCQANDYVDGLVNRRVFWVTSNASAGGAVGSTAYVEREVQAFLHCNRSGVTNCDP